MEKFIKKKPVEVFCRTIFLKVGEVDSKNEKFTAEAFIESYWEDDAILKHLLSSKAMLNKVKNPNNLTETDIIEIIKGLREISYDPRKYWSPELFVENALGDPKESINYKLQLAVKEYAHVARQNQPQIENLTVHVIESRKIESVFYERLELHDFPVDLQEISIKLGSKKSTDECVLVENEKEKSYVNYENFMDKQQYDLFEHVRIANETVLDNWRKCTRSQFVVSSFVIRKLGFYLYNAYLLIFLITSLGFATFSINPSTPHFRCGVTGLLLLTSVNFRWIITQRLPSVSYLTLMDKYTIGCLFSLSIIFIWHAIVGSLIITSDVGTLRTYDNYVLYIMAGVYALYNIFSFAGLLVLEIKVNKFKKSHSKLMNDKEKVRLNNKYKQDEIETDRPKSPMNMGSSRTKIINCDELEQNRA